MDQDTIGQEESTQDLSTSSDVAEASTPDVVDIDDDRLIRIKGSDKPVKFGEHVKGFQREFTKASQRAARYESELQNLRAQLAQYQDQQRQAPSNQDAQAQDIAAKLEALPYLTGKEAANVIRDIQQNFGRRDMVLLAALKKVKEMQDTLSVLHENHSTQSFESKISGWLQQGGYPSELTDWAKKLYLAYEPGPELDEEFPSILEQEFNNLQKVLEMQRQRKINAERGNRFVPGKGGNTGPSRQIEIRPDASAAEVADMLWSSFHKDNS